jgi:ferric-dicitrate binding protein FerR (iron transport regulator)
MSIFRKRTYNYKVFTDVEQYGVSGRSISWTFMSESDWELRAALLDFLRDKYLGTGITAFQLALLDIWREQDEENEDIFQLLSSEDRVFEILREYKKRYTLPPYLQDVYKQIKRTRRSTLKRKEFYEDIFRYAMGREGLFAIYPTLKYISYCLAFAGGLVGFFFLLQPHGGQQISVLSGNRENKSYLLPDGSKVWLNSNTSITFSRDFHRQVTMDGEAYFDVQKTKIPFTVQAHGVTIEVLGTTFNVDAYKDRGEVTTLITGKVRITSLDGAHQQVWLEPGQQCTHHQDTLVVSKYLMDPSIWVNGRFAFHDLFQAMDDVSRWYGYQVQYMDGVRNKSFFAAPPRSTPINELLASLSTYGIRAEMKGNVIVVYSK